MVDIFIPMQSMPLNCGGCGFLGWKVFVEPITKTIKGIETKAGKVIKIECGRCHMIYELEDSCIGGSEGSFRANKASKSKPVTQEQIDNDTNITA